MAALTIYLLQDAYRPENLERLLTMTDIFTTLSGVWMGRYDYGEGLFPVSFEAILQEEAGALSGEITEPNTFRSDMGSDLIARLAGTRHGHDVSFRKTYAGFDQGDDPVYEGVLNGALTRIDGVWRFADHPEWSGAFMMVRAVRAKAGERAAMEVAL